MPAKVVNLFIPLLRHPVLNIEAIALPTYLRSHQSTFLPFQFWEPLPYRSHTLIYISTPTYYRVLNFRWRYDQRVFIHSEKGFLRNSDTHHIVNDCDLFHLTITTDVTEYPIFQLAYSSASLPGSKEWVSRSSSLVLSCSR
jgi:hypothetical protein